MDATKILNELKQKKDYKGQICYIQFIPAKKAKYKSLSTPLPEIIVQSLLKNGISSLYTHQVKTIEEIKKGNNVVIVTNTASGKTLCYNISVIENILINPNCRSLYLFPTKALGQNQARAIFNILRPQESFNENIEVYQIKYGNRDIIFGTYDGDTSSESRKILRRAGNIILTNPDMLSYGILPNHKNLWAEFFKHLKFIVIDEIHTYRGIFGSHVANVIRRLNRICKFYNTKPIYICCSATIANPQELSERLTGEKMVLINEDGSPIGKKKFVFWNPPFIDFKKNVRRSPITEVIDLLTFLINKNIKTIVFGRAKPTIELILKLTLDRLEPSLRNKIKSYRGGYMPAERREIEKALAEGKICGIISTNALELGIDIGHLEAAILTGYPGSIASMWQQAGRAGRKSLDSLAIFVPYDEPLDQYFIKHPNYFFDKPVENAIIDNSNPYILSQHIEAAAYELPINNLLDFGNNAEIVIKKLIEEKKLKIGRRGFIYSGNEYPAEKINLRTTSSNNYKIISENNNVIGFMEPSVTFQYLHPGAIYLHQGVSYLVTKLDLDNQIAYVIKCNLPYYTRALSKSEVTIIKTEKETNLKEINISFGLVEVVSQVLAYKALKSSSGEVIYVQNLQLPKQIMSTQAFWFSFSNKFLLKLNKANLEGGLHAIEHASISMLPFFAMCDRNDIGGISHPMHPQTFKPTICIYDACEGGIGLTEQGYYHFNELMSTTFDLISECRCDSGCPSCIQSPKCGNMNEHLDKKSAIIMLKLTLNYLNKLKTIK